MLTLALFTHGAEEHAFAPIVAAGDNSARPHASARKDYRIKPGDALLFDFGARWDLLRQGISSGVARRSGSLKIVDSTEFGAPAWMKLITTFPLERYDLAVARTPECAVAEPNARQRCDAERLRNAASNGKASALMPSALVVARSLPTL